MVRYARDRVSFYGSIRSSLCPVIVEIKLTILHLFLLIEDIELRARSYIPFPSIQKGMYSIIYVNNYIEGEDYRVVKKEESKAEWKTCRIPRQDQRDIIVAAAAVTIAALPLSPQINSINRIKRQPSIIALAQSRIAGNRPSRGAI